MFLAKQTQANQPLRHTPTQEQRQTHTHTHTRVHGKTNADKPKQRRW